MDLCWVRWGSVQCLASVDTDQLWRCSGEGQCWHWHDDHWSWSLINQSEISKILINQSDESIYLILEEEWVSAKLVSCCQYHSGWRGSQSDTCYWICSAATTNQRSVLYCANQSEARTHLDVEWESFDSVEWFPGQEVTLKSQSKISITFVSTNHRGLCTWLDAVVPRLYQVSLIQTSASSHSTVTWWGPISCKSNVTKCIQSNNWFTLSLHKSRDISSYSSSVGSFTAWSQLHCLLPATKLPKFFQPMYCSEIRK